MKNTRSRLIALLGIIVTHSFAVPITVPDSLGYFRLSTDYISSGTNGTVWFSFTPQSTGIYTIVIKSNWGTPVFNYYGTYYFTTKQNLDFSTFSFDSGSYTNDVWVYQLNINSSITQTYYMSVQGGAPGVILDGFNFGICKANKVLVSSDYQSQSTGDTLLYVPSVLSFPFPEISVPKGVKFNHWSIDSGTGTIKDSLNPYSMIASASDLHVARHLSEWSLPVLSVGKVLISLVNHGITGYASGGMYLKFNAPEPGYYGFLCGRMVHLYSTAGDSCPGTALANRQWTWPDQADCFKDSIHDFYSILIADDRGSLADPAPFTFEIQKATLALTIDSTSHAKIELSNNVEKFVPGWNYSLFTTIDPGYRIDSIGILAGSAVVSMYAISLQTDATIKAFVSEKPVFPLSDKWRVFDFVKDKWDNNTIMLSFQPQAADTFTISAFKKDTLKAWSLTPIPSPIRTSSSVSIAGNGVLNYTFYGIPDSTYTFMMVAYYLPNCNQFASTVISKGSSGSLAPELCGSTRAIYASIPINPISPAIFNCNNRQFLIEGILVPAVELISLNGTKIPVMQQQHSKDLLITVPKSVARGVYLLSIKHNGKPFMKKIIIR